MIEPPVFDSVDAYGARLGDATYWRPYAEAALAMSSQSDQVVRTGFEGTYPTLVGERLVVKLFGVFPGWRESFAAEVAANRTIESIDDISAPRVVASGCLFPGNEDDWPFLVMDRLQGHAWRGVDLDAGTAESVARQVGGQIRRLHQLDPTGVPLGRDDWIAREAGNAAERHRAWGSLPAHLIDQLPSYLLSYQPGRRCLVHGDLTEDHLFVEGNTLVGIIDWGDAMITDPFYELGALHLGAFGGDRRLLAQFLRGYDWPLDAGFADRALQVALMHQFDLFGSVSTTASRSSTLTALARKLWTPMF